MNNVSLVGRITKDVEIKYTASNVATASFTVAVNRTFTNANGEREADFIPVVVWKKTAENVANFTKKGSLVGITGRIQTRTYDDKEGKRVYVTEVVAENVQFLEKKATDGTAPSSEAPAKQAPAKQAAPVADTFATEGPIDISDDDLPF